MAKSVGKYTGLQYRPLQGDVATDILNAEDQEFKHRAEQRLIADRKAAAKAKKDASRQAALNKIKNNKLFDTQSDSLNQVVANTVKLAQQEYDEIFQVLENQDSHSLEDITKAQLKLDYLNSGGLVDDLKILTSSVIGEYKDYTEKVGKHNGYIRDEDYENKFENGFSGIAISLDDNLRPVALFKGTGQDLNNDGIIDVETLDSLQNVYGKQKFNRLVDFTTTASEHAKRLTPDITEEVNGVTTTTTKDLDPDEFNRTVKRVLYNEDGSPSEILESFAYQRGLDVSDPKNIEKLDSDYRNEIMLQIQQEKKEKKDHTAALNYKKYNDSKTDDVSIGETVTPTEETWGKQFKNIDTDNTLNVPVSGVKIDAIPLRDGRTITDAQIVNYTYHKDGPMIVDVVYQDTKSETMTVSEYDDEMKKAVAENDNQKIFALQQATDVNGGKKVTLPGKKKKEQIIVSKENESKIASKVAGSMEQARALATKEQKQEEVDEFGIPIGN